MKYYLLLLVGILLIGFQFVSMKKYQKMKGSDLKSSFRFSMFFGVFICIAFLALNKFKIEYNWFSILLAFLLAIVIISSTIIGIKIMDYGEMSIYSAFMMIGGMVLPLIYGVIFFDEKLAIYKYFVLVALIIMIVVNMVVKKGKGKLSYKYLILCVLIFILNGLIGVLSSSHQKSEMAISTFAFMSMYGFFILILSTIGWAIYKIKDRNKPAIIGNNISLKSVGVALAYNVTNGAANLILLICAKYLMASIQYSIVTGGVIVVSSIFGALFYKEKIEKIDMILILVVIVSIVLLVL